MSDSRQCFVFQKEKCHPLESPSYLKVKEHVIALFSKENLKKGCTFYVPGIVSRAPPNDFRDKKESQERWKKSGIEFTLRPDSDWDDETYDRFYKLIDEYPWETYGVAKPIIKPA